MRIFCRVVWANISSYMPKKQNWCDLLLQFGNILQLLQEQSGLQHSVPAGLLQIPGSCVYHADYQSDFFKYSRIDFKPRFTEA